MTTRRRRALDRLITHHRARHPYRARGGRIHPALIPWEVPSLPKYPDGPCPKCGEPNAWPCPGLGTFCPTCLEYTDETDPTIQVIVDGQDVTVSDAPRCPRCRQPTYSHGFMRVCRHCGWEGTRP